MRLGAGGGRLGSGGEGWPEEVGAFGEVLRELESPEGQDKALCLRSGRLLSCQPFSPVGVLLGFCKHRSKSFFLLSPLKHV